MFHPKKKESLEFSFRYSLSGPYSGQLSEHAEIRRSESTGIENTGVISAEIYSGLFRSSVRGGTT
jgi:hypothetical protein